MTVSENTNQLMAPPVGMLSIADYLGRNGYKVLVDNIGERTITSESFNAEKHIANLSARVYWSRLLATLQNEKTNLNQLTMELFSPAISLTTTWTSFQTPETIGGYQFYNLPSSIGDEIP